MKVLNTLDRYKSNPECTCLNCENLKYGEKAKSCKAFPELHGIPPKVWNGKYAECEHYVPERKDQ